MLLTIDQAKVEALLKSSTRGYEVFTSNLPAVELENPAHRYSVVSGASGTIYAAPLFVTAETNDRLMAARRKILESGIPLCSPEDLAKEIDKLRGRG